MSSRAGRQGNVPPAMDGVRTADEIRDVNTRYHDVAAASYDSKWGIDFGEIGQAQVLGKLRKLVGPELARGGDDTRRERRATRAARAHGAGGRGVAPVRGRQLRSRARARGAPPPSR